MNQGNACSITLVANWTVFRPLVESKTSLSNHTEYVMRTDMVCTGLLRDLSMKNEQGEVVKQPDI